MNGPIWMIIVFVGTMLIGVPIPFAAGLATIIGLYLIDLPFEVMGQAAFNAYESFPLTTIPLFTLAGKLMEMGGMSNHLIRIARSLVGAYKGGLGLVTVVACALFAALSGSGPATTAAIGSITMPSMTKEGYKPNFAAAVSASAGALGSMIPPSNLLIIYALVTDVSIPRLFLAGIIPGVVITILLLIVTFIIASKKGYGGEKGLTFSWKPLLKALWDGKWAIGAPIIILGGIYTGFFTPSEAAAVAVAYGLFVGFFVYKGLSMQGLMISFKFTAVTMGTVLFILGSIKAFGTLVTLYDIPEIMGGVFADIMDYKWLVLILIGIFYMIIGMWLDTIPQIIIFTAVFLPIVEILGVDPVLFGVFTVMTCEVGFLTPPIGTNLFVASKIADISIEEVSVGVIPFLFPYILIIFLLAFWGDWVTYLPNLIYGVSH